MKKYKVHKVSYNIDQWKETVDDLEKFLNEGWKIERADAMPVSYNGSASVIIYGPILYVLSKNEELSGDPGVGF